MKNKFENTNISIDYSFQNQSSGYISDDFEKEINKSFEENVSRYLMCLVKELNCNSFLVQVVFYPSGDNNFTIRVNLHSKINDVKGPQEFTMSYNFFESKDSDYITSSFITDFNREQLKKLIKEMYIVDASQIVVSTMRVKPLEGFGKKYSKIRTSKLFPKDSFFYKQDEQVHQFINKFIIGGINKIRRAFINISYFYVIGETNNFKVCIIPSIQRNYADFTNVPFFMEFNAELENYLLDYFVSEKMLLKDLVEQYKIHRNIENLIEMTKLLEY